MRRRSWFFLATIVLITGCGHSRGPLVMKPNSKIVGPWCAPNERVKIGERVVGHVHEGDKWAVFYVDDKNKEHDPDHLAEQVWSYLEGTGDAKIIESGYDQTQSYPRLWIVSIKPLVVLWLPRWNADPKAQIGKYSKRYQWLALIRSQGRNEVSQPEMKWFSPDHKQRPTALTFSDDGIAEIPLKSGRMVVTHEGKDFTTKRE